MPTRRHRFLERSTPGAVPFADMPRSPYERARLLSATGRAIAKLASRARRHRDDEGLAEWLLHHRDYLGEPLPFDGPKKDEDVELSNARLRGFAKALASRGNRSRAAPSALQKRLDWIGDTLALEPLDRTILGLAVRSASHGPFHRFVEIAAESHLNEDEIDHELISTMLDLPMRRLRPRLRPGAPLIGLGLLEHRHDCDFAPSGIVMRIVGERTTDPSRLGDTLLGTAKPTALKWEDFEHLDRTRDLGIDLVRRTLDAPDDERAGLNILLYGEPGTGKTEFAKVLARCVQARAVFVGEADEEGGEPNRSERLAHLALASRLAAAAGRTVLVVDEADDIFTGVDVGDRSRRVGSKVFSNRIVEGSSVPTIWITNQTDRLGNAVMRRMGLAIRFRAPDVRQRRRMVTRIAKREGVDLAPIERDRLARIDTSPALVEAGLRAASLAASGIDGAELATNSLARATGGRARPPQAPRPFAFDAALANADVDLAALAHRIASAPSKAISFLLSGPPGTGKSAYAAHLAEQLGMEPMVRRASDLMSMWVGGTEKAIAAAFEEARDRNMLLLIDEADSMLRTRAGADRSWEITQVNEMLTWMESHPLPFAMTTNAIEHLDPAAMRRFVFKVAFQSMRRDQVARAFETAFGKPAPAAALRLEHLTPGDFAAVTRRAAVLGEDDPDRIASLLVNECAYKPEASRGRIGFATTAGLNS